MTSSDLSFEVEFVIYLLGAEDSDWDVSDVDRVRNVEKDRIILHPEGEFFTCEIEADREEKNTSPVRCYCR